MKIHIAIQEMATSEILNIVPTNYYNQIKKKDPNPLFKAFIIGHEGESRGKLAVDGQSYGEVIKRWAKKTIQKMFEKVKLGLELFHGHDKPENMNIHDGRDQIGEVVGKDLREIDGRLSTVAVGYIYPQYRNLKLDTASIEAFIDVDPEQDDEIDVKSITGIALADKDFEMPGFPHAGLLAQLQAFTSDHKNGGNEMADLTIGKIIDFARTERVRPSEIFKKDDFKDDPAIKEYVKEEMSNEYNARKRVEKEHEDEKKKWEEEKQSYEKTVKDLKTKTISSTVDELFDSETDNRKLSDEEKRFIKRNLKHFEIENPEDETKVKESFSKFLDDQVDEFKELQSDVFGKKEESDNADEEKEDEPDITGKTDLSDIDKNDMIPD